jgi:hypothetical protein
MESGPAHLNSVGPVLFWTGHSPTRPMTMRPSRSCPRARRSAGHPAHLPRRRRSPRLWDSAVRWDTKGVTTLPPSRFCHEHS